LYGSTGSLRQKDEYSKTVDNCDDEDDLDEFRKDYFNVLGFNSAKFDWVLLIPFLNGEKWEFVNNGFIGTPTKAKQVMVGHKELKVKLRFLDLMMYAPGSNLKGLVKTFGDKKERMNKGLFPYDVFDITIPGVGDRKEEILEELNNVLCRSEPFMKDKFFNQLSQEPMTNDN
jgi:hypothetical protein